MDEKERIEKIMQIENLNSAQFAMETGIQTSTLSHILNGRNKVSLEVLKRILNRFRNINSDWLILGQGSMYRQEKHSQAPTLFDFDDEKAYESIRLNAETKQNSTTENTSFQEKSAFYPETKEQITPLLVEKPPRKVKKIIVYYDDNSFQEFYGD